MLVTSQQAPLINVYKKIKKGVSKMRFESRIVGDKCLTVVPTEGREKWVGVEERNLDDFSEQVADLRTPSQTPWS